MQNSKVLTKSLFSVCFIALAFVLAVCFCACNNNQAKEYGSLSDEVEMQQITYSQACSKEDYDASNAQTSITQGLGENAYIAHFDCDTVTDAQNYQNLKVTLVSKNGVSAVIGEVTNVVNGQATVTQNMCAAYKNNRIYCYDLLKHTTEYQEFDYDVSHFNSLWGPYCSWNGTAQLINNLINYFNAEDTTIKREGNNFLFEKTTDDYKETSEQQFDENMNLVAISYTGTPLTDTQNRYFIAWAKYDKDFDLAFMGNLDGYPEMETPIFVVD